MSLTCVQSDPSHSHVPRWSGGVPLESPLRVAEQHDAFAVRIERIA